MHELIENLPGNMEAPGTKIRALKGWGGMVCSLFMLNYQRARTSPLYCKDYLMTYAIVLIGGMF